MAAKPPAQRRDGVGHAETSQGGLKRPTVDLCILRFVPDCRSLLSCCFLRGKLDALIDAGKEGLPHWEAPFSWFFVSGLLASSTSLRTRRQNASQAAERDSVADHFA